MAVGVKKEALKRGRNYGGRAVQEGDEAKAMKELKLSGQTLKKLQMSALLTETKIFPLVVEALRDQHRRAILSALLEHEASIGNPLPYTELRKALGNPDSNKFSYHLNLLRKAALVRRVTDFSTSDAPTTSGYRSFYRTTALLARVLKPYLKK